MKLNLPILLLILVSTSLATAEVIKPVDVRATSHFGLGLNVENLINGDSGPEIGLEHFGLIPGGDPGVQDDLHGVVGRLDDPSLVDEWGYISGCADAGIEGGDPGVDCSQASNIFAVSPVDDQIIEFEFDGAYDLSSAYIWNDNEDGFAGDRGVDEFEIQVSPDRSGDTWTAVGTTYNLTANDGFGPAAADTIEFTANGVRRVRLLINTRLGPANEQYVGLSEVRFEGTLVTQDLKADGDNDGDVDGLDFLRWQYWYGLGQLETFTNSTLQGTRSRGDYDASNAILGGDLAVWASEYGSTGSAEVVGSVGVPEPTALGLVSLGLIAGLMGYRRSEMKKIA